MLEKITKTDKVEAVNLDTIPMIQVRNATWIGEDGVMVGSKGYSRYVLTPDSDVSNEPASVQAMAAAIFTDEVKAAYAAKLAEQENI